MEAQVALLCFAVAFFLLSPSCEAACVDRNAGFLVEPSSVTAALNTTATFHFIAIGVASEWKINGLSDSDPTYKNRISNTDNNSDENCILRSTLTVPATVDFNNSKIECIIVGGSGLVNKTVRLTIQGLVGPPLNVKLGKDGNSNILKLTWDPPFMLDITDVDPYISGYTICTNVSDHCLNTTDTVFQFPALCMPVEFTVSANNILGKGKMSKAIYSPTHHQHISRLKSTHLSLMLQLLSESGAVYIINTVKIPLQIKSGCHPVLNIHIYCLGSKWNISVGPLVPEVINNDLFSALQLLDALPPNEHFNIYVNEVGNQTLIGSSSFTTFDVQKVTVDTTTDLNSVTITCSFAKGSPALGSLIMLTSLEGSKEELMKIAPREKSTGGSLSPTAAVLFSNLQAGRYTITVFDLEYDGCVNLSKPCYYNNITITGKEIPTPAMTQEPSDITTTEMSYLVPAIIGATIGGVGCCLIVQIFIIIWMWHKLKMKTNAGKESPGHTPIIAQEPTYEELKPERKVSSDTEEMYEQIPGSTRAGLKEMDHISPNPCPAYAVSRPRRRSITVI